MYKGYGWDSIYQCCLKKNFYFRHSSKREIFQKKMSMDSDINLATLFTQTSKSETNIVRFFVNLPFASEIFDVHKNVAFPAPMVVSLSRKDFEVIKGFPMKHIPYKPDEITAWMKPTNVQIPPLCFPEVFQQNKQKSIVKVPIVKFENSIETLDFGSANGLFDTLCPIFISLEELDFGDASGFF